MRMKAVKLGAFVLPVPVIQGGMGIGISRCNLAGAVAREGGMGVISAAQIGYDDPEFYKNPEEANLRILPRQIRRAKEMALNRGLIGVNIMSVTRNYEAYVKAVCKAGADAIISGAGLPAELPKFAEGFRVALAPIVSTARSAGVILKYWDRKYNRSADFLVIEGPKAGGHLGFSREELARAETAGYDGEIRRIIAVKADYEKKYRRHIPVFCAGGIFRAEDAVHALELGADGIQAGTRFIATRECDASEAYKQAFVKAKQEDVVIVDSPVGMPGRAIKNAFIETALAGPKKISHCFRCLKACNPAKAPYCITRALINAVQGNVEQGLLFCGSRVGEITDIVTVSEVMKELAV